MKRTTLALLGLLAALVLAACGTTDRKEAPQPSPSTAADHNSADVRFAQEMIPHHRQAIEMAQMATERASSLEVKALAERIEEAQGPEIDMMTQWLESWDEEVSPTGGDHMMGDEMMGGGMMTAEEMSELMAARGAEFDRMFLTLMTVHHEGAVEMARVEQAEGSFAPAQELAGKIIEDQQAEIDEMAQLLSTL